MPDDRLKDYIPELVRSEVNIDCVLIILVMTWRVELNHVDPV